MSSSVSSVAIALGCAAALTAAAADAPRPTTDGEAATPPMRTVYLYGQASLDELRSTNVHHYLRARDIMAAAPRLCRSSLPERYLAQFDAHDVHCLRGLLKTSNPPKWQLEFRLDDVHYVALVTVTGAQPRLMPAR